MSRMNLHTRLGLGFGTVLLLLAVAIALGVLRLSSLNDSMRVISQNRVPNLAAAYAWKIQLLESAQHTRNMLILEDKEKITWSERAFKIRPASKSVAQIAALEKRYGEDPEVVLLFFQAATWLTLQIQMVLAGRVGQKPE